MLVETTRLQHRALDCTKNARTACAHKNGSVSFTRLIFTRACGEILHGHCSIQRRAHSRLLLQKRWSCWIVHYPRRKTSGCTGKLHSHWERESSPRATLETVSRMRVAHCLIWVLVCRYLRHLSTQHWQSAECTSQLAHPVPTSPIPLCYLFCWDTSVRDLRQVVKVSHHIVQTMRRIELLRCSRISHHAALHVLWKISHPDSHSPTNRENGKHLCFKRETSVS